MPPDVSFHTVLRLHDIQNCYILCFPYSCVVRGYSFYIAILLPTAVILLLNFIVLILVMRGLSKGQSKLKASKTKSNDAYVQVRIAFACSVLLGLTWLFAVLAVGKLTDTFQWLFCIFNSFQGFFIFIFYTARNKDARIEWKRMLSTACETGVPFKKCTQDVELKGKFRRKATNKGKDLNISVCYQFAVAVRCNICI